ncbi:MAG: hypothetical protein AAF662_12255 [Pseudomonadota bacterium]
MSFGRVSQGASDPTSGITLFFENQIKHFEGNPVDSRAKNTTALQPVVAFPIAVGDWNIIARPRVRYTSSPSSADPLNPIDRIEGMSDSSTFVLAAPSPKKGQQQWRCLAHRADNGSSNG